MNDVNLAHRSASAAISAHPSISSNFVNKLRQMEMIVSLKEALNKLETILTMKNSAIIDQSVIEAFIDEFIVKDCWNGVQLTAIQTLQTLVVLCDFFSSKDSDQIRNMIFLTLFQTASGENARVRTLCGLVWLAVSLQCRPVLSSAALWMQQLGFNSPAVLKFTAEFVEQLVRNNHNNINSGENNIKEDKDTSESDVVSPFATSVDKFALLEPHLAANLVTVIADIYRVDVLHSAAVKAPPRAVIQQVSRWLQETPYLLFVPFMVGTRASLPAGSLVMSPVSALCALFSWTIMLPLTAADFSCQLSEQLFSRLQFQLLSCLMEFKCLRDKLQLQPQLLTGAQLTAYCDQLLSQRTAGRCQKLAVDRLAQMFQTAAAVGFFAGTIKDAVAQLERLQRTQLIDIITNHYQ